MLYTNCLPHVKIYKPYVSIQYYNINLILFPTSTSNAASARSSPLHPARVTSGPPTKKPLPPPPSSPASQVHHRDPTRPARKAAAWPPSSLLRWAGAVAVARPSGRWCSLHIWWNHGWIWGLHGGDVSFHWGLAAGARRQRWRFR
jgi:hypothetical protein